jgi:hypothetical protein
VVSPSGVSLVVRSALGRGAITDRHLHYASAVAFDVPSAGNYEVTIHSSTVASFVVAKDPWEELKALGVWIVGGIVGIVLIVASLVGSQIARGRKRAQEKRLSSAT